jgi:hypothetical protein
LPGEITEIDCSRSAIVTSPDAAEDCAALACSCSARSSVCF